MIAQRFRSLAWVAGVAGAACTLYLVSLQVASERARLEDVNRKIAAAEREIRQLQTELGTRASLRQLERWNSEALSLSAPAASQYLPGETALATLDLDGIDPAPAAPPPVMMAVLTPQSASPDAPQDGLIERLTTPKAPPRPLNATDRAVQKAIIGDESVAAAKPQRLAMLDRSTMADIDRRAAAEQRKGAPAKP